MTMRTFAGVLTVIAIGAGLFDLEIDAFAQSRTGFAVNRFEPAERGSPYFVLDALDLRGDGAAGVMLDYAYKPLVIYDAAGEERAALVRHQTFVHLGGSLVLAHRLRLSVDAPVAIYQDGEAAVVGGEPLSAATAPAFGDLRLAADVRLFGQHGQPLVLAAGARVWLPTGLRSQFTSDGSARVAPQVLGAGVLGPFAWAARLALVYRSRDDAYAGRSLGSELFGAVGGGWRGLDGRLMVGPELFGSSAFTGNATFLGKRSTVVEWTFGAHYDVIGRVRVGAGMGGGLGHAFGAPLLRALFSLEWVSAEEPVSARVAALPEKDDWVGVGEGGGTADGGAPRRPLAVMTESEIHIEEELRFATDSAELAGESDAVLSAVKRILEEHPELRVRIEGHTDAIGDPAYNDDLSARRAAAVASWLVRHGIDAARLESAGLGSKEPLDTNDTEAGRAKNRRVVFRLLPPPP